MPCSSAGSASTASARWASAVQLGDHGVARAGTPTPLSAGRPLIAVEAAVLHNFGWHERWTWRDRPRAGQHGCSAGSDDSTC